MGSGAFPLGLLQKLVHMLDVLDPGGEKWKARNRLYYERRLTPEAEAILAANERAAEIGKAEEALAEFDAKVPGKRPLYTSIITRKLFLWLDRRVCTAWPVQPIAVQIAKLRCFISLAVEQRENPDRPNRGITPLPRLEAKFVAANTLTPLHRRGQAQLGESGPAHEVTGAPGSQPLLLRRRQRRRQTAGAAQDQAVACGNRQQR